MYKGTIAFFKIKFHNNNFFYKYSEVQYNDQRQEFYNNYI